MSDPTPRIIRDPNSGSDSPLGSAYTLLEAATDGDLTIDQAIAAAAAYAALDLAGAVGQILVNLDLITGHHQAAADSIRAVTVAIERIERTYQARRP